MMCRHAILTKRSGKASEVVTMIITKCYLKSLYISVLKIEHFENIKKETS